MPPVGNMVTCWKTSQWHSYFILLTIQFIDLRTSYVEFVLAFFKFGDTTVKKDILQVKDLVSPIFKGLERDAYPVCCCILHSRIFPVKY